MTHITQGKCLGKKSNFGGRKIFKRKKKKTVKKEKERKKKRDNRGVNIRGENFKKEQVVKTVRGQAE